MNSTELANALLGCQLTQLDRSWWAVKLSNDEWLCEARLHVDIYKGTERNYEWYEDLVCNDDVLKIKELWLLCPSNALSPLGNTARLVITEPGTAFNFKIGRASSNIISTYKYLEAHIIGRVTNKETGDCECFIYDEKYQVLCEPFYTNVHDFGTWRESLPPRGPLAVEKMGVKL